MHTLKPTRIGNAVGVIFPQKVPGKLQLEKGDSIFMTDTPAGYALTPHDPNIETQLQAAEEIIKRRRHVLRELAK